MQFIGYEKEIFLFECINLAILLKNHSLVKLILGISWFPYTFLLLYSKVYSDYKNVDGKQSQ